MAKRKTKEQREQEAYDALYQRVLDICNGACGSCPDWDNEWLWAEALSRAIPVLRATFLVEKTNEDGKVVALNEYLFAVHNLNYYENPTTITDFLFENRVRV